MCWGRELDYEFYKLKDWVGNRSKIGEDLVFWNEIYLCNEREGGIGVMRWFFIVVRYDMIWLIWVVF